MPNRASAGTSEINGGQPWIRLGLDNVTCDTTNSGQERPEERDKELKVTTRPPHSSDPDKGRASAECAGIIQTFVRQRPKISLFV